MNYQHPQLKHETKWLVAIMNSYQDRGIIKWMPFDALSGFGQLIYELTHTHLKKTPPMLLDDQLNELDYLLQEAFRHKRELTMIYYKNHAYIQTTAWIRSLDFIHKTINLSTGERVAAKHVIYIESQT